MSSKRSAWARMRRISTVVGIGMVAAMVQSPAGAGSARQVTTTDRAQPLAGSVDLVTLVTGDRVEVRRDASGRTTATLRPGSDRRSLLRTVEHDDAVYVIPSAAEPLIDSGRLDRELFNVNRLVDAARVTGSQALPLIVTYGGKSSAKALARRAAPAYSTEVGRPLESVNGQAVRVKPRDAAEFWGGLTAGRPDAPSARTLNDGVAKVWLDKVVSADLSESVPQIGAPEAWAAGYDGAGAKVAVLDTGYDPTHPDLAGQVTDTADFSGEGIIDRHGHGTHVASTVAGTGAGSGGRLKGVAPGADLLIGKVMDASGSGMESWLIDGMQWAVDHDADVVNMSLSTEVTDGYDPLSQAVNDLSASSDTLFVATAGNTGPDAGSARAPGNADAALSVAAVDKSDVLADFSSRGPRFGDSAIKPDLAAPGVDIVAARAAGTSMDRPVDDLYTMASGTSMAAPHIAGAAAILAQRHPQWGDEQIKAALMSTSKLLPDTVYEAGSGRVDVAAAVSQPVVARAGSISFGTFAYSEDPVPTETRTVTFDNTSDAAVELALDLDVTDADGDPAPDGLFSLAEPTVAVPAHGTAGIDVTLDPNAGPDTLYGGQLVATGADGARVHVALGAYLEPEMVDVVVEGISQSGDPAGGASSVDLWNLDTDVWSSSGFGGKGGPGPARFRVPVGTYSVDGFLWNLDETGRFGRELALVAKPEITITGDTTLVLDATGARRSDPITSRPTEQRELTVGYYRSSEKHSWSTHYLLDRYVPTIYLADTEPVSRGDVEVSEHWELYAPEFTMSAGKSALDPEYAIGSPRVDGSHRYDVVDAGQARPSDLANVDVRGKLALIEYADDLGVSGAVQAVQDAGATAAIVYNNQPGVFIWNVDGASIPTFTLEQQPGVELRNRLNGRPPVRITIDGTPISPYTYDLFPYWEGRVPSRIDRTVDDRDLARLDARYLGYGTAQTGAEVRFPLRPYDSFAIRQAITVPVPSQRTEWVTPGAVSWQQVTWAADEVGPSVLVQPRTQYRAGQREDEDWFAPIGAPGVPTDNDTFGPYGMPGYREGDRLTVLIRNGVDSREHYDEHASGEARFYRNGVLVAEGSGIAGSLPASADRARYRFELDTDRDTSWSQLSTRTKSAWEFTSQRPPAGKQELLGLLQLDYDVQTDLRGVAKRGRVDVGLSVHRQGTATPVRGAAAPRVWASYDEGASWRQVDVRPDRHGSYDVALNPPRSADSASLRVHATDSDGNLIEQEVIRAFGLSG